MTQLSSCFVVLVLSCGLFALAQADVSSLRYNRHFDRVQTTRLQRQEANATPYPAAGFRPNRQFDYPAQRQPQWSSPAEPQQSNFDQLSPAQQPQQIYGAPVRQPVQQPSQQQQQLRLLHAQQQQIEYQQRQIQQLQQLVQEQQQQQQEQQEQQQQQEEAQQQEQPKRRPQLTYAAPQSTYGAPEATAEASETQRQVQAKPARLTATREDVEDDEDDARTDVDADSNDAASATEGVNKPAAGAVPQPQPAPGTIAYFPAGAVTFVHPAAAAYGLPAAAYTLPAAKLFAKLQAQPAYFAASPAAQPQLVAAQQIVPSQAAAYIAAPGQLQAW